MTTTLWLPHPTPTFHSHGHPLAPPSAPPLPPPHLPWSEKSWHTTHGCCVFLGSHYGNYTTPPSTPHGHPNPPPPPSAHHPLPAPHLSSTEKVGTAGWSSVGYWPLGSPCARLIRRGSCPLIPHNASAYWHCQAVYVLGLRLLYSMISPIYWWWDVKGIHTHHIGLWCKLRSNRTALHFHTHFGRNLGRHAEVEVIKLNC
jgi:hypothetical protein